MHSEEWEKMMKITKEAYYKDTEPWDGIPVDERDQYNKLPKKLKRKLGRK